MNNIVTAEFLAAKELQTAKYMGVNAEIVKELRNENGEKLIIIFKPFADGSPFYYLITSGCTSSALSLESAINEANLYGYK